MSFYIKTISLRILLLMMIVVSFSAVCFAQFGGGDGTAESPYQIGTAAHLNAIRDQFLANNLHYVQTANIDLDEAPWNEGAGWEPIGENATRFQGTFNGGEFAISGLTINRNQQYQGLFGYTSGATLQNITLTAVDIENCGQDSGALVGRALNTRIDNCVSGGTINSTVAGRANIGGLLGYYSGQMTGSSAHVDVTVRNGDRLGGLIGDSWGNVSESYATGDVIGNNRVGGLCGNDYNGLHEKVLATGNVEGNDEVGGLYGFVQTARYHDCYATGDVRGNSQVGGLIGNYNLPENVNQQLYRAYSIGIVEGNEQVGGLIGRIRPNMAGPFNSYWNTETSGQEESAGGEGLTIVQMLDQDSFENWEFFHDNPWRIDPGSFPYLTIEGNQAGEHNFPVETLPPTNFRYTINEDRNEIRLQWNEPPLLEPIGYHIYRDGERLNEEMLQNEELIDTDVQEWTPYVYGGTALYMVDDELVESTPALLHVIITNFAEGNGSPDSPYTVSNPAQLRQVSNLLNAHFIQTEDIDLADEEWEAVGSEENPFYGGFDGNDFTITGMSIDSEQSYQGLFAFVSGANLTDISLQEVEITGENYIGALAGRAVNTTVEDCYADGTVNGNSYVGGLIGQHEGRIFDCYSHVRVEAEGDHAGGLIGHSTGIIERSYATGEVQGARFVGGLAGFQTMGGASNCFAIGNVDGTDDIGGFIGSLVGSRLSFSYATGHVSGRNRVGGLLGTNAGRVHFTYSMGRVTGQNEIGGLVGSAEPNALAELSYWDTGTSGQDQSAGGEPRDERHMTYPYGEDTYVQWDFERVWVADNEYRNRGYPYLEWQPLFQIPYPDVAANPTPAHRAEDVSVDLEELRWTYGENPAYTEPLGFRVYFNTSNEFGDDDYAWVPFIEEQENYSISEILPENIEYITDYYWKVVPTTDEPNRNGAGRSARNAEIINRGIAASYRGGDAQNVPVWSFTTELNPIPVAAVDPQPEDEAENIHVTLEDVSWTFNVDENHANPVGFRVYMNTTGEFGDDDDFVWVPYVHNQANYNNSSVLPEEIEYAQIYYWKVVPTTTDPQRRSGGVLDKNSRLAIETPQRNTDYLSRNDADNVPVWSFSTITSEDYPVPAINPDPEHLTTGISLGLAKVSWDYLSSEVHADPVGFRVYMNTSGVFGQNAPYAWIEYVEDQVTYSSAEAVPEILDEDTIYYWRVIPTVNHPDERQMQRTNDRQQNNTRGDAQDCPVWRFTTGTTDAEKPDIMPIVTELHNNYPNPFNPYTSISFSIAEAGNITIDVVNIRGQKVAQLINEHRDRGTYKVSWDGTDDNNRPVGSGVYLYRMRTDHLTESKKMIMVK